MTAWRVYAVVFSILAVFSGLGRFVIIRKKPEAVSRMDLVEASVSLFMLPGLFGYAWHRGYGPHLFWMIAVPVLAAMGVSQLFTPKMGKVRAKVGALKFAGLLLFQVALGGPALYALIRYTFFSPALWPA